MSNSEKEKELVKGLKDGISWSFDELFKLYASKVFKFAFSYLKSEETSKEIVQETFMGIWIMHKTIDPDQSFKSLLFTLAYNNVMSRFRERTKEKKYRDHILSTATEYYEQERFFWEDDIQSYVLQTIDKLPPRRKEIFILRKEYNLSYKEISEKLGISIKTVENNINQAIKFIKGQVGTEAPIIIFFSFLFI
jgi:RNA polymerase sigma-70 factor (ECF subfamily)